MTSTNLWVRLKRLFPDAPLLIGEVVAAGSFGATVQLPDGAQLAARGEATLGQRVFVRDGLIEGQAPDLAVVLIEI